MRAKLKVPGISVVVVCVSLLLGGAMACPAATAQRAAEAKSTPGQEIAKTISTITGVAISPLLGAGAVGAYQYWKAPPEKRARLPWFAQMWFWGPALLLAAFVGLKDVLGAAAPTALKKPFDVAETIENKISGLIMAGAFIPLIISVFPSAAGESSQALAGSGFAAISASSIGNALMVPFALAAYLIVWMASHAINILILISPFTTVDTALKGFRLSLLSLLTATSFANPYVAAGFCVLLILICYFIAGWSFRLTVYGTVYTWDFFTRRHRRFQPGAEQNRMFTACKFDGVPVRTYGTLKHLSSGRLEFVFKKWLILGEQSFALPEGDYVVGRGLFYPEISRRLSDRLEPAFSLPPRFRTHEEAVARAYSLAGVVDTGLLKGLKAGWRWLKSMFSSQAQAEKVAQPAPS